MIDSEAEPVVPGQTDQICGHCVTAPSTCRISLLPELHAQAGLSRVDVSIHVVRMDGEADRRAFNGHAVGILDDPSDDRARLQVKDVGPGEDLYIGVKEHHAQACIARPRRLEV